jgi:DNA-directed RNA polymerase subunit RPC12/RpoP
MIAKPQAIKAYPENLQPSQPYAPQAIQDYSLNDYRLRHGLEGGRVNLWPRRRSLNYLPPWQRLRGLFGFGRPMWKTDMTMKNLSLPMKHFQCVNCGQIIEVPQGCPKPVNCPRCGAPAMMIHRLDKGPSRETWRRWGPSMAANFTITSPPSVLELYLAVRRCFKICS